MAVLAALCHAAQVQRPSLNHTSPAQADERTQVPTWKLQGSHYRLGRWLGAEAHGQLIPMILELVGPPQHTGAESGPHSVCWLTGLGG